MRKPARNSPLRWTEARNGLQCMKDAFARTIAADVLVEHGTPPVVC